MSFGWPAVLVALIAIPAAVGWYVGDQRRRVSRARRLADEGLVAARAPSRWRHVPFACSILALTALLIGLARPSATIAVPRQTGTVLLAFDVSNSMAAEDLAPTRLDAARAAAQRFLAERPPEIKVGVVAFGSGALLIQAPTDDDAALGEALERLKTGGGTATGAALFTALGAIAGKPLALTEEQLEGELDAVDIGYFRSATILLFSDGENTSGANPVEVAQLAANAGVRISAVGVGTDAGAVIEVDGFQLSATLDEAMLQEVAELTGGTYRRATDDASLDEVYRSLSLEWTREGTPTELTAALAMAGVALLLVGAALGSRINGRVV